MKKSIQVVNNHHHQQQRQHHRQQPSSSTQHQPQQPHLTNFYLKNNDDNIQYQTLSSNNNNTLNDNNKNSTKNNNNNNLPLIIDNNNSMSSSIVDNSSLKNQLSNVNLKEHQHLRPNKSISNPNNLINKSDLIAPPSSSSTLSSFSSLNTSTNCSLNLKGYISESSKQKIADIISDIGKFNDIEKLYLYLQLPDGSSNKEDNDVIKKTVCNAFSKKADSDVIQTYAWIKSHLEEDISVSIPKHEVYEEYKAFCEENKFEKLCVADFGKAMKHVFPHVKPRRLGQRGNSKYCYSGLKKKFLLQAPELPIIDTDNNPNGNDELQQGIQKKGSGIMANDIVWNIILEWVEKTFNRKFKTSIDFARFLIETQGIKTDLVGVFNNNNNNQNKSLRSMNNADYRKYETNNNNNKCSNNINQIINCKPVELNANNFVSNNSAVGSKVVENGSMYNGILKLLINPQTVISNIPIANNVNIDVLLNNNSIQYKPITNPKNTNEEQKFCATIINDKVQSNNNNIIDSSLNKQNTTENIINVNSGVLVKKEFDEELNFTNSKQLNDKNFKRQIDEKELNFMAKKRHVENITTLGHQNSVDNGELKLNDLETEALNEYLNNTNVTFTDNEYASSNNNSNNNNNFVKIKKILENHLSQENCPTNNNNNNSSMKFSNNRYSTLQNLLTKNADNNLKTFTGTINGNNNNNNNNHHHQQQQQQVSSPSCRPNAFSFQPITSPHNNTPTIFEYSALEMTMFTNNKLNNSIECKQTVNACVGPSQSSSETNSPFVSPRNTPLSRSRNNSGQSAYNNYRQTPVQNFDSGVSSISSSPFISPQSTPIPSTRIRPLDNNINANARVRHSSGPGGPVNRFQMVNLMSCNRSNSLSPMIINENSFSNQNTFQWPQVSSMNNVELKSDNQKMSVVTQTDNLKDNNEEFFFNFETNSLNKSRHRHFSNPYGGAMVKNDDNNDFKTLLNRSQSVPLHQMFESESDSFEHKTDLNRFNSTNFLDNTGSSLMPILDEITVRSMNELNDVTSTLDDLLTNEVIQSGQDLIVSSVQLNTDTEHNADSNQPTSIDDLNVPLIIKNESNNFNNILINDTVEQLPSLDAFHDCDNDFSNIELDNSINNYEFST